MAEIPNVVSAHESTTAVVKVHYGSRTAFHWPMCRRAHPSAVARLYGAAPVHSPVDCKNCLRAKP